MIKTYKITVNGKSYDVTVEDGNTNVQSAPVTQPVVQKVQEVQQPSVEPVTKAEPEIISGAIESPMPGKILKVLVAEGDKVAAGQLVMVLEAMKMENEIFATADGTVQKVIAKVGSSVNTGDPLVVIA